VNDPDETTTWPVVSISDDVPERFWADGDGRAATADRAGAEVTGGLISLAFIGAALRRGAWVWCSIGLLGLLIGSALYAKYPPAYQASAAVLVQDGTNVDPAAAVQTDATLASSRTVATEVVNQLGLQQSVSSFRAAYTVTVVTNQVLLITVGAPSGPEALSRTTAVAAAFLKFHTQYAQIQQQQLATQLDRQVSQARQRISAITKELDRVSAEPSSPATQARIASLNDQRQTANSALSQVEQYATDTLASAQTNTNSIAKGSRVLDEASLIQHSRLKAIALYMAGGLVGGLVIGMAIVIILALISDRLRRRDDVADAIGAPVRLSVGPVAASRWPPQLPGRAGRRALDMRRVVTHLRALVPGSSRGPAGLAVVAVDNAQVVARVVVALATSAAREGKEIVVADLSADARAARLLGVRNSGVQAVSRDGTSFTVVVPDREDIAPIGPLAGTRSPARPGQADGEIVAACASADMLLTLATLDPAFGGDHLATWATDVVAVVTAGQSSGERIHGVGEMIRLAGTRLDSVVLLGADKSDESLGISRTADEPASAGRV
jgi:capsular polysaccharide biosynthesis protein